ncbi:HAMP domain-containing sensor histidine kinase [Sphaerisporangium sp. B11E5]|uniref:sensor histidine kinase n=1 Tax=Sphaerisporangium sp. B11E5 TaxID=3153563 RepID=UPI00325F3709
MSLLPDSIRTRTTVAVAALSLLFLSVIGASLDFLALDRGEAAVFQEAQRAATNWLGTFQPGSTPPPTAEGRINLLQLVDSQGHVELATPAAAGRPRLATVQPPVDNRVEDRVVCPRHGPCLMIAAIRVPPLETREIWHGDPHFIYAGMVQPPLLASHLLESLTAAGVLLLTALIAWGNWWVGGRTLRTVEGIRSTMAEITVSDLSMRVPQPPGRSEFAHLACTANQTLDRLEEAVKQQRRFASTTSHELRTPLTGLRTSLEEAMLYPREVDPRQTIRDALSVTQRLEMIVDDLLVLARLRAGDPAAHEPLDLGALVRDEAAAQTGGLPVEAHVTRDLVVRGSRIQLIRVVGNLLANARRHAESLIEVTAERVDGYAVVTVTDDGAGIAPADRERVFERFVRLDEGRRREPGGSGLGLAISRDIAHAHDGTLRIEDSPRGARFVLRLPLMDPPPGRPLSPGVPAWRA